MPSFWQQWNVKILSFSTSIISWRSCTNLHSFHCSARPGKEQNLSQTSFDLCLFPIYAVCTFQNLLFWLQWMWCKCRVSASWWRDDRSQFQTWTMCFVQNQSDSHCEWTNWAVEQVCPNTDRSTSRLGPKNCQTRGLFPDKLTVQAHGCKNWIKTLLDLVSDLTYSWVGISM